MNNCGFFVLNGLLDKELGPFGVLLSYLLGFNSRSVLSAEGEVCDGDIFEDDVKILGTFCEAPCDLSADL